MAGCSGLRIIACIALTASGISARKYFLDSAVIAATMRSSRINREAVRAMLSGVAFSPPYPAMRAALA